MSSVLLYAGLSAKVQWTKQGEKTAGSAPNASTIANGTPKEPSYHSLYLLGAINGHKVRAMYKKWRPVTNSPPAPRVSPRE
jgi:hypothetical protein